VSVGFIPIRWENGTASSGFRRKYLEQELLEVSAVGIPANSEALQLGLKAGAIQKSDLRELLELLRAALGPSAQSPMLEPQSISSSHSAGADSDTSALGVGANEAQWLQLAREVRCVLGEA
jgi:hypothetical protein